MNPYKVVYSGDWNFSDSKDCPFCGEKIKMAAIKCKHCSTILNAKEKALSITEAHQYKKLSPENIQVVLMLFDGFYDSLQLARWHIQLRNFDEKSKVLIRAIRNLTAMHSKLDFEKGGETVNELNDVYKKSIKDLIYANEHNDLAALENLMSLINLLRNLVGSNPFDTDKLLHGSNQDFAQNSEKTTNENPTNQPTDSDYPSEYEVLMEGIKSTDSRLEAAAKLGISPRTLRYKLAQMRTRGMTDLQY